MNPFRNPVLWLLLGGVSVLGVLAWQQRSIHQLREEIASLQTSPPTSEAPSPIVMRPSEPVSPSRSDNARELVTDPRLERRVAVLEDSVALLGEGADHLMNRGSIPPSEAKLAEWNATFFNFGAPFQERLAALRMLRRNNAFTPQMAQVAATWLATSTDPGETRSLLESLRGANDPVLMPAMLSLASTSPDERVRDRAIQNLRDFISDPQVEAALWQIAGSDPSDNLRRRAQDTLRRLPMTDARASSIEARALSPSTSLEERLTSLRLLGSGNQDVSRIAASLAQAAQTASDPETRLKYYAAFDDINNPSFMLPLVQGAQDSDASVRRRATDALLDYRSEPAIAELLRAMAESDPDPRVRQEAARIFQNGQR